MHVLFFLDFSLLFLNFYDFSLFIKSPSKNLRTFVASVVIWFLKKSHKQKKKVSRKAVVVEEIINAPLVCDSFNDKVILANWIFALSFPSIGLLIFAKLKA